MITIKCDLCGATNEESIDAADVHTMTKGRMQGVGTFWLHVCNVCQIDLRKIERDEAVSGILAMINVAKKRLGETDDSAGETS